MSVRIPAVLFLLASSACTSTDCAEWGAATRLGAFDSALEEISGLVASRSQPGVLYAHNDSGDSARFFAVTTTGKTITEFLVDGATNVDWEDLGLGACPAGTCLFIGDLGDNTGTRTDLAVYRLTEPTGLLDARVSTKKSIASEKFPFVYPDGAHYDAEALFVHPTTGRVYVVTKEGQGERSHLFRFPSPMDSSTTATLEALGKLSVPTDTQPPVTAADVSPSGRSVLIRMGLITVEYRVTGAFDDFKDLTPVVVPTVTEPQGEAVAYLADGLGFVTSTELAGGPPLDGSTCVTPRYP